MPIDLEEVSWQPITWVEESTRRAVKEAETLAAAVGRPIVVDAMKYAKSSGADDALMALVADTSDFYYVRLPISVRPPDGTEMRLLSVNIELRATGGTADAWSMEPTHVQAELKVGTDAKLQANLKLGLIELGGEGGRSNEYVEYQPVLEAYNLGRADPAWEFRPADGRAVRGVQLLHLCVRQDKTATVEGAVSLSADLQRRNVITRLFGSPEGATNDVLFRCP
jgi:hypothetical protein